jgi:nucleoside-diphosphate-sugar epimerase
MNFVLGGQGRLGRAIVASAEIGATVALDRSVYASWAREGVATDVTRYFESVEIQQNACVFVASGIIDPACSYDEHYSVNYVLARNIIQGANRCGLKVVTFGSIMELFTGEQSENPYFSSKSRLGNFVREFAAENGNALHMRIHTLYGGGPPSNFMFLGQMYDAISRGLCFDMSDGCQLREYHHVDDEAKAIARLARSDASGVIELSHGLPFFLRDLAVYVFEAFGCVKDLRIGSRPRPRHDNFDVVFPRPSLLNDVQFRNTFPAVVEYLRTCGA